ncbi:MAG: FIST N-terminal domain-containing protein [Pseudomonadota bacterium]
METSLEICVEAVADPDTGRALAMLLDRVAAHRAAPPDFMAVHGSVLHDADVIRAAAAERGVRTLHGGTSCRGVMAGGRMLADADAGLGLFALWDSEGAYGTGIADPGDDPVAAGSRAAQDALAAAGRPGEAPALVWLTAAPGCEEALLAGIEAVVGPHTPILGGSAADNDLSGRWQVYDRDTALGGGAIVSVLFPSRPLSWAYQSGYAPATASGIATRVEGRRVLEIDHRPAAEVYAGWTGGAVAATGSAYPANILSESTFHPFGRRLGDVGDVPFYLLAHPASLHADGGVELFAGVGEGERLELMTGSPESLATRAGRVARLAAQRGRLAPGSVAGALVVYCAGCMLALGDGMARAAEDLDAALDGAPALGIFSFGEQGAAMDGVNRHGNLMISCVSFAR